MITREADYAIRTILYLAQRSKNSAAEKPISVNVIAEEMNIPYRFLRRISRSLRACGLTENRRGKDGGMFLRRKLSEISLKMVIDAVNPQALKLNLCMTGDDKCGRQHFCPVCQALHKLQQRLDVDMGSITFDQFV